MRACAVNTYVKISQEPLYTQIYGKNAAAQNLGPHFVRARAVETHVKISQEPLYAEIYTKDAAAQIAPPTQPMQSQRTPHCWRSLYLQYIYIRDYLTTVHT